MDSKLILVGERERERERERASRNHVIEGKLFHMEELWAICLPPRTGLGMW
jgi:hypothetical protein